MAGREIILASQSPRRRELLSKMGYEFICDAADVDEHVQGQAREIVGILARRKAHAVLARHKTGVCLLNAATGREQTRVVRTGVTFRQLSEEEIRDYVATGEPMDKAGAYGIQGGAGKFVSRLDGSFENVMGFPVDTVDEMLKDFLEE